MSAGTRNVSVRHAGVSRAARVIIVSHTRRELELWTRAGKEWTRQVVTTEELRLRRGAVLSVDRLYADLPE